MQNRVMTLVRKRLFDFSNISATPVTVVALDAIDVGCFGDALLAVRVHSNEIGAGGSTIQVEALNTAPSDEDPDLDFVEDDAAATVKVGDASNFPAGTLLLDGVEQGFGPALQIRVVGTRIGVAVVKAEISVELVARGGVAAPRRSLADTLVVGNFTGGTDVEVSSTDEIRGRDGASPAALNLRGGAATAGNTSGAGATVRGGVAFGSGTGGSLTLEGGSGSTSGAGGLVDVKGGAGGGSSAGGAVKLTGGASATGVGGSVTLLVS